MGRTNPTFRDVLRQFEQEWQPYRRSLRRQDQEAFDELLEAARTFADAAGQMNTAHPNDVILFSMILTVAAEQRRLDARLSDLEATEP